LFEMSSRINDLKSRTVSVEEIEPETFRHFRQTYIDFMEEVLGLKDEVSQDEKLLDSVLQVLIDLRKKARDDRNYAMSDRIRDDLKKIGVQLKDGKDGEMSYEIE
jgi:cysteinyl-tRNA synthetase